MLFVLLAVLTIAVTGADDAQNEIASNKIEEGSTETAIAPREFVDKTTANPRSGVVKARRGRYLRQASRPRRRPPPFDVQPRNIRRPPGNNYPNLYGPRSRFKMGGGPYRSMPPKPRFRYYRRNKWSEQNQPYYLEEDEMEPEPYDEYDELDDMKGGDDPWYAAKYRDGYDDVVPVPSKYNEKRSPARFAPNYPNEYLRQKMRASYDGYDGMRKEPVDWPERTRFTKAYRDYVESMAPSKKYVDEEPSFAGHRFKFPHHPNRFKTDDDNEFDFSGSANLKSRRYKADPAVMQSRRPSVDEVRYEQDIDIAKYLTGLRTSFAPKEAAPEPVYSAKYRGRDADKEDEKKKLGDDGHSSGSAAEATVGAHDWKRAQKPADYQEQYLPSKVVTGYDKGGSDVVAGRSQYKDDQLLPSELIAYMSADPAESSVVGKEERYLHAAYPFLEKLSDHDILKATFPRKISPVIDQDLEITFEERMGDWKHN